MMGWEFQLGDPDVLGITTTLGYLLAALGCVWAALHGERRGERRQSLFWLAVALLYLALGINKQADLQIMLTDVLRRWARADGWYDRRREYQLLAVVAVFAVGVVSLAVLATLIRRWPRSCHLALAAAVMQMGYVGMRLISFHYLDALLSTRIGDLALWKYLELSGTLLCLVASLGYVRMPLTSLSADDPPADNRPGSASKPPSP